MVAATDDPVELWREAVRDGDVLVIGEAVDTRTLYRNLFEVGHILDRP